MRIGEIWGLLVDCAISPETKKKNIQKGADGCEKSAGYSLWRHFIGFSDEEKTNHAADQ